ncbi:MAG: DSD1 family PLP-dependent enzyme [Acidobacteriota bacterium]
MTLDLESLTELPTPSLLLDADVLERNLLRMNRFLEQRGAWARPHTKTHKCVEIARLQMAQSRTVGLCCARIAEAEALAAGGLENVLVTSPLTTAEKIERFAALASRSSGMWTVVDSPLGVDRLAEAARSRGVRCGVIIDLDPGFHRTGVPMGEAAIELGRRVLERPELELHGVQMYAGTLMHLEAPEERRSGSADLWQQVSETVEGLRALGADCPVVTGGGTGTFDIDAEQELTTDLQVGSYVFMDAQYRVVHNETSDGSSAPFDFFEPSLFVLASAVSQSVPHLLTVDAGFKALSMDHAPEVVDHPKLRYHFAGDEHGIVALDRDDLAVAPKLGERMVLLVSHCDPTVNLYEEYVVLRDGRPTEHWPVRARGRA